MQLLQLDVWCPAWVWHSNAKVEAMLACSSIENGGMFFLGMVHGIINKWVFLAANLHGFMKKGVFFRKGNLNGFEKIMHDIYAIFVTYRTYLLNAIQ